MKEKTKGWLKEYLELRQNLAPHSIYGFDLKSSPISEYSLYKIVQPTGLMYGQPIGSIIFRNTPNKGSTYYLKIILAENLINCSFHLAYPNIQSSELTSALLANSLNSISRFYNYLYPELSTSYRTFFGRKRTSIEVTESILNKRIQLTYDSSGNFWAQIFQNCLLFLDIYIYEKWGQINQQEIALDFFKYEKDELRISLIKIIAAAAHSNSTLEKEERLLLDFFLNRSGLTNAQKRMSKEIFEKGVPIEDIDLPVNSSWILNKFFLEVAILTTWSDGKFEEVEYKFIKQLATFLSIPKEEVDTSLLAVEGFALENWSVLGNLQDKVNYNNVSADYIERLTRLATKNKRKMMSFINKNQEILELLKAMKASQLTASQELKLKELLLSTLKKIPSFGILALPQRFLTLTILLQIFPPEMSNRK